MTASRAQRRGPSRSLADSGDGREGHGASLRAGPEEVPVGEPLRLCSTVPAHPSWGSAVRLLLTRHLAGTRLPAGQLDDAVLAVGELFANAVKHASTDPRDTVTVTLESSARTLRVTVADHSPALPQPCAVDEVAESGRGPAIVAAPADDWGIAPPEPGSPGKRVWFVLHRRGAAP
ncbi:ATP-binding protein [Streptomyces sp. NPDC046197]|uniref:ATP-binding protein n=1 Tax=Streptomyces sp. NPDC046197 TaxID=3154337 RepID=UPI0033F7DDAB